MQSLIDEEKNTFPQFVSKTLAVGDADLIANIPSVNACKDAASLRKLHHKLVRFDC